MVQRSLEETRKNTVTIEATQRLHQQQKAAFKEQSLLLANLRAQLTVITRQLHAQRSELEAEKALGLQQTKDLRALETILRNEGIDGVEERDRKISHDELRHLESELEAAARDCDREVTATQKLELTATELLGLEKGSPMQLVCKTDRLPTFEYLPEHLLSAMALGTCSPSSGLSSCPTPTKNGC